MAELQHAPEAAREALRPDTLIIGFTGSPGSGCSFVADGIKNKLGSKAHHYMVSGELRRIATNRGITNPTVADLQNIGNEERSEKGLSAVVETCIERVKEDAGVKRFGLDEDTVILIDGIKNEGEVRYLRFFANFWLISVQAERETRENRSVGPEPDKKFKTTQEFDEADARDQLEEPLYGQQVRKCNYLADIILHNAEDFPPASEYQRDRYFDEIVKDYINPMRTVRKGERIPERPPSVREALMTMAYCASKRSSCLKRNVGAVIARVRELKLKGEELRARRTDAHVQFQVISAGCNEVPPYSEACVFEFDKCYRDYLRETKAAEYKNCPACGEEIPQKIQCPRCGKDNAPTRGHCLACQADMLSYYECSRCGSKVFDEFMQGSGKFLDQCRALHAEENAIIGMSTVNSAGEGDLFIYTTTFPCKLCANKIVQAGIKHVVYAEPYTQEDAKKVLDAADVDVQKFEGVKSTAYFRLYS